MSNPNQFIGVSHVERAKALLATEGRKLADFWWLFPLRSADDVLVTGGIAMPADSDPQAEILEYRVPQGMKFVLTHTVNGAALAGALNSAFAPGDGSVVFTLDLNNPIGGVPVGAPVKGFSALTVPLGGFPWGPWPLPRPRVFDPLDVLRWKVLNVSLTTAEVFAYAGLFGYTIPANEAK